MFIPKPFKVSEMNGRHLTRWLCGRGSGRRARFVALRSGICIVVLNLPQAIEAAREALAGAINVTFYQAAIESAMQKPANPHEHSLSWVDLGH